MSDAAAVLRIDGPIAECGDCYFVNRMSGTWSVEDGRLVFRADVNPLRSRGPGFFGCSEGRVLVEGFAGIEVDGRPLTDDEFAALKAAASVDASAPSDGEST